jgi:hypothetical protein
MSTSFEDNNNDIKLTAQQRAKQKYYLKIKSDPSYKEKQRESTQRYYNKNKNDIDFKIKINEQQRVYYMNKKIKEFLPTALLPDII